MSGWFDVDKKGLAAIVERRGKAWALNELVANALDADTDRVEITLIPTPGEPYANLIVEDWGTGFEDFDQAHTMFARSARGADPTKRGRFALGEKLVLAVCRSAVIRSVGGSVRFSPDGDRRRLSTNPRERGTLFTADIRLTRDEYTECCKAINRIIPPVMTRFNGVQIERPTPLVRFETKLQTEFADQEGQLRRTVRNATVEVYEAETGQGDLLELGIPVVELEAPYRVNVLQKIPLNMDRDNVTPAFLRSIYTAVLNNIHDRLEPEQAAEPWVQEAAGDGRATKEAIQSVITRRFGPRAVIATPGDPVANARAEQNGYTVIHGGSLSADVWANVKKADILKPSSAVFPTAKPEELAAVIEANAGKCPLCGK